MTNAEIHAIEKRQREHAKIFSYPYDPSALSVTGRLCLIDVPRLISELRDLQAKVNGGCEQSESRYDNGDCGTDSIWVLHPAFELKLSQEVHGLPAGSRIIVVSNPVTQVFK